MGMCSAVDRTAGSISPYFNERPVSTQIASRVELMIVGTREPGFDKHHVAIRDRQDRRRMEFQNVHAGVGAGYRLSRRRAWTGSNQVPPSQVAGREFLKWKRQVSNTPSIASRRS